MLTNFNIFIFKIYCKYSKLQPIYYIILYYSCRENIHNLLTDSTQIFLTNYLNKC